MHSILRAANRGLRSDSHGIAASLIKRSSTRAPNPHWSSPIAQGSLRWNSSAEKPASPPQALPHKPAPHRDPNEQVYQLTFTCKVCRDRSSHTISKQGYHKGTILIKCPECNNRHLISDHLKVCSSLSEDQVACLAKAHCRSLQTRARQSRAS